MVDWYVLDPLGPADNPINLPAPLCDLCVSISAFQLFSISAFTQKGAKGNVRAAMADLEMWMG
jgi:hypothetical protein